ncbi:hypothetical protein J6590_043696 [Homalodisca vitripennis]|nr:hypothetical protein J6590_043696 [Homalodisca vitripennis]
MSLSTLNIALTGSLQISESNVGFGSVHCFTPFPSDRPRQSPAAPYKTDRDMALGLKAARRGDWRRAMKLLNIWLASRVTVAVTVNRDPLIRFGPTLDRSDSLQTC